MYPWKIDKNAERRSRVSASTPRCTITVHEGEMSVRKQVRRSVTQPPPTPEEVKQPWGGDGALHLREMNDAVSPLGGQRTAQRTFQFQQFAL